YDRPKDREPEEEGLNDSLFSWAGLVLCPGTRVHPDSLLHCAAGDWGYREGAPEPYDQPFADDGGKVSPALFQRPAGCKDPGSVRPNRGEEENSYQKLV